MTRSEIMGRVRSRGTRFERNFKNRLDGLGITDYVQHEGVFHPDFSWPGKRVAVFLDSCFWHGCPEHFVPPKTNVGFWEAKMARNRNRDSQADAELMVDGWTVFRIWEHDVRSFNIEILAEAVSQPVVRKAYR